MKKISLVFLAAFVLIFSLGTIAYGSGFSVDFGYEQLRNDLTLSVPGLADLKVNLSSPWGMYVGEVGYEFNSRFSIKAGFGAGSSNLAGFQVNPWPGFSLSDTLDLDNTAWNVEAKYKLPLGDKFAVTGIVGYTENKTTIANSLTIGPEDSCVVKLKQNINGAYAGAGINYNITGNVQLGASYQVMVNPVGSMELELADNDVHPESLTADPASLNGLQSSVCSVYLQANLSKNWSLNTGYKAGYTCYSMPDVGVSCIPAVYG